MITQMEVITPRVTNSPLPVSGGSESTDPIQIIKIDGLGPVKASVNTAQYGSVDGEFYNGSVVGKRNIVITVRLNPNWLNQTVEGLRNYLYQYFMPKNKVTLKFTSTHMAQVSIDGYVEACEPNHFSKDPEYQISIICPKPAFVATSPSSVQGQTLAFGAASSAFTNIQYEGTLDAGFVLDVVKNAAVPTTNGEIRVVNTAAITSLLIATPVPISSDASFELSTVTGSKYARTLILPGTSTTSIVGKVQPGSQWLQFTQGLNSFRVLAATPGQDWSLTYTALYGGL